jgi:hypothetical protein
MADTRDLDSRFRPYADRLLELARQYDASFMASSTRRTPYEQQRLYSEWVARGRTGLPAARPGRSFHEWGLAIDVARPRVEPLADPLLRVLGQIWKRWGGFWSPRDPVHFQ